MLVSCVLGYPAEMFNLLDMRAIHAEKYNVDIGSLAYCK